MRGKRILLVDDEKDMREAIRHILAEDRHTLVEANNGAEALGLFGRSDFDLVLTDHRIPFMTGSELAQQIRQWAPRQRILMITAYGCEPGPTNPVDVVIHKPFDPAHLREVVSGLLLDETEGRAEIEYSQSV